MIRVSSRLTSADILCLRYPPKRFRQINLLSAEVLKDAAGVIGGGYRKLPKVILSG
jgi:hypothetical protein